VVKEKKSGWVPDVEEEEGLAEEDAWGRVRNWEAYVAKDMALR
jgi:hypothetical protein